MDGKLGALDVLRPGASFQEDPPIITSAGFFLSTLPCNPAIVEIYCLLECKLSLSFFYDLTALGHHNDLSHMAA
jgi:hypothetical protein